MALLIFETRTADDARECVWLACEEGELVLKEPGADVVLPLSLLVGIFDKFGRPLDDAALTDGRATLGETLTLGPDCHLVTLRYLDRFDVIATDYLVLKRNTSDALVVHTNTVAAALMHVAAGARVATTPR